MALRKILTAHARSLASKTLAPFDAFFRTESSSGVLLLAATAVAFIWANTEWSASYEFLSGSVEFWVNDVLMTVFFLAMTLEIRREMEDGALATVRTAALPLVAAAGGIVVPAAIYTALNFDSEALRGWAIPTATDIAFAVGVLTLLGRRATLGLRTLLVALAIVDDVAAILIIALAYPSHIDAAWLLLAGSGLVGAGAARLAGMRSLWLYVVPGFAIWFGLFNGGIHPTLAGVVIAFLLPVSDQVQNILHKVAAFVIMPVFAVVNAGVSFDEVSWQHAGTTSVAAGTFLGFVIGKPLGVIGATYLGVRAGWCSLPPDVTWRGVALVGCLAGIGFTMAIFISELAFGDGPLLEAAKLGILAASVVAATCGLTIAMRPRLQP